MLWWVGWGVCGFFQSMISHRPAPLSKAPCVGLEDCPVLTLSLYNLKDHLLLPYLESLGSIWFWLLQQCLDWTYQALLLIQAWPHCRYPRRHITVQFSHLFVDFEFEFECRENQAISSGNPAVSVCCPFNRHHFQRLERLEGHGWNLKWPGAIFKLNLVI